MEWAAAPDGFGPFDSSTCSAGSRSATTASGPAPADCPVGGRLRRPHRTPPGAARGRAAERLRGDQFDRRHAPLLRCPLHRREHHAEPRAADRPRASGFPRQFFQTPIGAPFFGSSSYGLDGIPQTADDPPFLFFEQMLRSHCDEWSTARSARRATRTAAARPTCCVLDPNCNYDTIGMAADKPNPFRTGDVNPLTGQGGALRAPLPAGAHVRSSTSERPDRASARGIYYPNDRLQQLLRDDDIEPWQTKLRRAELAWNRGQSQQDQKELKELYVDVEMFDSRLWVRVGLPDHRLGQDRALPQPGPVQPPGHRARLPHQPRGVAHLPVGDPRGLVLLRRRSLQRRAPRAGDERRRVRAHGPRHLRRALHRAGRLRPLVGQLAHGYFGVGLAGQSGPRTPGTTSTASSTAARLEFRWDRFSFAITDFYGFQDFPYVETVYSYCATSIRLRAAAPHHDDRAL